MAEFGVWREVEPSKLLMPNLSPEEARTYAKLVDLKIPKVILNHNRDMDWLFGLWGNGNIIGFSFACIYVSFLLMSSVLLVVSAIFSDLSPFSFDLSCSVYQSRDDRAQEEKGQGEEGYRASA